jgi:Ca2+-binding EF-hand superfamily protein
MASGHTTRPGVSFTSDFSKIGSGSAPISGGGGSILDEERRLIDKVFSIVDRDNSGSIDTKELHNMFELCGVQAAGADMSTINRIMANVDKNHDNTISSEEFYKLLSRKFGPGDSKKEIDAVFARMDKNHDGLLDVEDLFYVSQLLGENMTKADVKDMIKRFSKSYKEKLAVARKGKKKGEALKLPESPRDGWKLDPQDFYNVMMQDLEAPPQ